MKNSVRALALGLAVAICSPACTHQVDLYCDEDTPCEDPSRPFCDLEGQYPASEGVGRTCIAYPWDAGTSDGGGIDAAGGADAGGGTPDAAGGTPDGGGGTVDASSPTIDATGGSPDASGPLLGLGQVCETIDACVTGESTACLTTEGTPPGFCSLSCGTTSTSTPPTGGDAICVGAYSGVTPDQGTPACGVMLTAEPPYEWYCVITCGMSGGDDLGGCPGGLTCGADWVNICT